MFDTVPHSGMPGILAVRLVQVLPPSRVICTRPSLVPAQMTPVCLGDSARAKTTPAYSTPILSPVSPPEKPIRLLSLRVRSGLTIFQVLPPSVVTWTNWLPT